MGAHSINLKDQQNNLKDPPNITVEQVKKYREENCCGLVEARHALEKKRLTTMIITAETVGDIAPVLLYILQKI